VLFFAVLVTRQSDGEIVWRVLEVAAVVLVAVAVWRFVTGARVELEAGTGRLRVLWGGGTLLLGWLVISRLLRERVRIRDIALGVVGLAGVVLINHRSAYIALPMGVLVYIFTRRRNITRTIGLVVLVLGLAAVLIYTLLPVLGTGLAYSVTTMLDPSADANTIDRVYRWRLGLDQFAADPFGDVIWRGSYYLVDLGPGLDYEPHNFIVQLLDAEGLVGFLAWSSLLVIILATAFRNARRDHGSAVLGAYVAFYLTFCLFNTNFYMSQNVVLLVAPLGLILWRDRLVKAREREASVVENTEVGASRDQLAPGRQDRRAFDGWNRGTS